VNTTDTWHVPDAELERYVAGAAPVGRGTLELASIEAHLLACERCRATLASSVLRTNGGQPAHDGWQRIAERIDQSHRPVRSSTSLLHVSVASPPLLGATLGLAALLLVSVVLAAAINPRWAAPVLIALAPLGPVVGAALAYQPRVDPAGRLAAATPLASGRLPLLRALIAAAASLMVGLVATLVVPLPGTALLLWLLPGLAFAAIVLAVGTWVEPSRAAAALATGWMAIVLGWAFRSRRTPLDEAFGRLFTDQRAVQMVCVGVTVVAAVICHHRRDALPNWRTR
jgi:hypothetical protein